MADVLAAAVRDRQRVPEHAVEIAFDDDVLVLDRATVLRARRTARRTRRLHNLARPIFVVEIIHALAQQVADRIGDDPYADETCSATTSPRPGPRRPRSSPAATCSTRTRSPTSAETCSPTSTSDARSTACGRC